MPAQRVPNRRWTEEEFYAARDAAPFSERWELVDGDVLVTPSSEPFVLDLVQFFADVEVELAGTQSRNRPFCRSSGPIAVPTGPGAMIHKGGNR